MNARLRLCASIAALGLLGATGAAQAQMHIAPGLWEEQISMKTDNPQANAAMARMQEKMASLPPDQRKAMQDMMASRGVGTDGTLNSVRVCITKEQAETDSFPDRDGHCSRKNMTRSGNVMKFNFVCGSEGHQVSGEGMITATSATSFTGSTTAESMVQGKPWHMRSDVTGKFISRDCGDVKPIASH